MPPINEIGGQKEESQPATGMAAIGIDIGGTKMAIAAVDQDGKIHSKVVLATEARLGFERAITRIIDAIQTTTTEAGWGLEQLCGIGIGCAGPVDPVSGTIHNHYTLPGWDNCDIGTLLRRRFWLPVFIENDADAALLGECFAGAGGGCDSVVMLTFGTGVGGGALVNGQLFRGVGGEHPEIGHIPIESNGPQCYCGIGGCLESIASGTAISDFGRQAGIGDSRAVFSAAAHGVPEAVAIVGRAVNATRMATWTLLHTFMPQRIILGGGLMDEHFERFAQPICDTIQRATQSPLKQTSIQRAMLGNNAGVVGAAHLVFRAARETADGRILGLL